jgi:hypothetical protein
MVREPGMPYNPVMKAASVHQFRRGLTETPPPPVPFADVIC